MASTTDLAEALAVQRRFRSGGTSQTERLPAALRPELLQLDGRSLPQLLAYVARLSEHFLFYDAAALPNPRGPWALSRQRSLLLLAVVADQPNVGLAQVYAADLLPLLDPTATGSPTRLARQRLLQLILRQVLTLIGWARAHQHSTRQRRFADALAGVLRRVAPALREAHQREQRLRTTYTLESPPQLTPDLLHQLTVLIQPDGKESKPAAANSSASPGDATDGDDTTFLVDLLWQLHREQTLLAGVAKLSLAADLQNQSHRPEVALLVAFLELYRHAQRELNDIPRRHLNHYYEQVLHTAARPSTPDQTYLVFALVTGGAPYLLPAGALVEGQDSAGQRVLFATADDAGLASWRVAALATQYVARQPRLSTDTPEGSPGPVTGIYASAWVDPAEGMGPGALAVGASWPLFGEDQSGRKLDARTIGDAPIGWAVATSVLKLPNGHRAIVVQVNTTVASFASFLDLLNEAEKCVGRAGETLLFSTFRAEITGPVGWCPLTIQHVALDKAARAVRWSLTLENDQPAASGYDATRHGGDFATVLPVLRFVLNGQSPAYAYSYCAALQPTSISLRIAVDRVAKVALRNPLGEVDAATPFAPFGAQARPGDYLLIDAPELRGKNLRQVALKFVWQHLPPLGLAAYYTSYQPPVTDGSFRIGTAYQAGGRWCVAAGAAADQRLFEAAGPHEALAPTTTIQLDQLGYLDGAAAGQLRVTLVGPAAGFGADTYPTALVDATYYNARNPAQPRPLPPPPFVLLAQQLTISYEADELIYPTRGPVAGSSSFYHLLSFSASEPAAGLVQLLPDLPHEGTLFVGLKGEAHGQTINIVFELTLPLEGENGSAEPLAASPQWAYLHQDAWVPIAPAPHLANGLAGIASSCAVEIKLPANLVPESQQLPGDLCWLRATVAAGAASFGPVRAIHTQLVRAVRMVTKGSTVGPGPVPLPVGSLTRLTATIPQIGLVGQPVPSFGGRPAEDEAAYYRRVSERLRHRNRLLTPSDYEHLVLELFPEVHSAKCLRPGQLPGKRMPGQVILVVLPQADAVPGTTLPLFGAGQLDTMKQVLRPLLPLAVQLDVRNPCYELIQVRGVLAFHPPASDLTRLDYPQQLQLQLAKVLSPWQQDDPQRGGFHHEVTMSGVLAVISQQPFVAAVTGLSLIKTAIIDGTHRFYDSATKAHSLAEVTPSVPWAVLVPALSHALTEPPGLLKPDAVTTGIGDLRVGAGFIIDDSF